MSLDNRIAQLADERAAYERSLVDDPDQLRWQAQRLRERADKMESHGLFSYADTLRIRAAHKDADARRAGRLAS
jgi:hypothetical protein